MDNRFQRNEMLIGKDGQNRLMSASVIVFGVGGVGSSCVESLVRSGVGKIALVDADDVDITNINRQLHALSENIGRRKTQVMADRIHAINPQCETEEYDMFYLPENADAIPLEKYDYIVDAIDTVSAKLELIVRAKRYGIPIISCMGTGNKLHPELLEITDIYKTKTCPLCRVMRKELKSRDIKHLKVVYSEEEPIKPCFMPEDSEKKHTPGSMPFVPPVAGFLIASAVVSDLLESGGRK